MNAIARNGPVRRVQLGEIAELRGGFVPSAAEATERARLEEEIRLRPESADVAVDPWGSRGLMPRAIGADGEIAWGDVVVMLTVRNADRFLIRERDVLLPLRSQSLLVAVAIDVPFGVLAVGQWAIITPNPNVCIPDYLAWYLNHPQTRARLMGAMTGTSLQFLTLRTVRDFEVELPSLTLQRRIGRVATLTRRAAKLERDLTNARRTLVDAATMDALVSASNTPH